MRGQPILYWDGSRLCELNKRDDRRRHARQGRYEGHPEDDLSFCIASNSNSLYLRGASTLKGATRVRRRMATHGEALPTLGHASEPEVCEELTPGMSICTSAT